MWHHGQTCQVAPCFVEACSQTRTLAANFPSEVEILKGCVCSVGWFQIKSWKKNWKSTKSSYQKMCRQKSINEDSLIIKYYIFQYLQIIRNTSCWKPPIHWSPHPRPLHSSTAGTISGTCSRLTLKGWRNAAGVNTHLFAERDSDDGLHKGGNVALGGVPSVSMKKGSTWKMSL